jgi:hypothetical protein
MPWVRRAASGVAQVLEIPTKAGRPTSPASPTVTSVQQGSSKPERVARRGQRSPLTPRSFGDLVLLLLRPLHAGQQGIQPATGHAQQTSRLCLIPPRLLDGGKNDLPLERPPKTPSPPRWSGWTSPSPARMSARSSAFSSSRTFPGQERIRSRSRAVGDSFSAGKPLPARKRSAIGKMSSRLSRRGGTRIAKTFRR